MENFLCFGVNVSYLILLLEISVTASLSTDAMMVTDEFAHPWLNMTYIWILQTPHCPTCCQLVFLSGVWEWDYPCPACRQSIKSCSTEVTAWKEAEPDHRMTKASPSSTREGIKGLVNRVLHFWIPILEIYITIVWQKSTLCWSPYTLTERGGSLLGVSAFSSERAQTFIYIAACIRALPPRLHTGSMAMSWCSIYVVQGCHCSPCHLRCHQALDEVQCEWLRTCVSSSYGQSNTIYRPGYTHRLTETFCIYSFVIGRIVWC